MSIRHGVRRGVLALAGAQLALFPLLLLTGPAPAGAAPNASRPSITLDAQSQWLAPATTDGTAPFNLTLTVTDAQATDQVEVLLYPRLITRSSFETTLRHGPGRYVVTSTAPVTVTALPSDPATPGAVDLAVTVATSTTSSGAASGPVLDLGCAPPTGEGTCAGVYPVEVELRRQDSVLDRFTTFLTYTSGKSVHPLRVAWVVPITAPVRLATKPSQSGSAIEPLSSRTVASLTALISQLDTDASVPVTLEASPQTLQALDASGPKGRSALAELRSLSKNQSVDEIPAQPYVPIDLGALAGAGEPTEILAQMTAGRAELSHLHVTTSTDLSWVVQGSAGPGLATGVSQLKIPELVVPSTDLAPATSTTTWASTFPLLLKGTGSGSTVTAAVADGTLTHQFQAVSTDPALAATQLLANLAMVHFEEPTLEATRGLVAMPPAGWKPNSVFDRTLLAGLSGNPLVMPVTLSQYFSSVAPSGVRRLATAATGATISPAEARGLSHERLRLTAFDSAVVGNPAILTRLDQLLLASESTDQHETTTRDLGVFDAALSGQLRRITFAREHTVTLTARTGWIPITVVKNLPYKVVGLVTVASDKFEFPHSPSHRLLLAHATNPWRVDVVARTSGESSLTVTFTSPKGTLVIARGRLTVRSTATSLVGLVLSGTALAVLLAWWARTWLAGRRRRAAEER